MYLLHEAWASQPQRTFALFVAYAQSFLWFAFCLHHLS